MVAQKVCKASEKVKNRACIHFIRVAQIDTMKLQQATQANKRTAPVRGGTIVRARVTHAFKDRIKDHCQSIDRTEGWLVRRALQDLLDRAHAH